MITGNAKTNEPFKHREPKLDWMLCFGVLAVCAYVLPWVISGESGYVQIHDSLDSLMAWYTVMKEHGFWFAPNLEKVGPIFENGTARISYPNELSIVSMLFALLEPYWAYVAYQFTFRLAAFSGMYVLLLAVLPREQPCRRTIVLGVSLCYALLPYFTWVSGPAVLAWITYVLVRTWHNQFGPWDVLILLIAPLFSTFAFTGFFVVGTALLLLPVAYTFGQLNWRLVGAVVLLSASHIAIEYRLFQFILFDSFETQRIDFVISNPSLKVAATRFLEDLNGGHYHAPSLHSLLIMPVVGVALLQWASTNQWLGSALRRAQSIPPRWWVASAAVTLGAMALFWATLYLLNPAFPEKLLGVVAARPQALATVLRLTLWMVGIAGALLAMLNWLRSNRRRRDITPSAVPQRPENGTFAGPALLLGSILILAISIFYGAWQWSGLDFIRETIPILGQFNLTRINFARPFVWMLGFAFALMLLARTGRRHLVLVAVLAAQITVELNQHEFLASQRSDGISFKQFMAEDQFRAIEQAIAAPKASYIVGSIGLHPSIAQYNGFRTADAYFSLYPKSYKMKFREAVFEEFSRRPELLRYFDEWGSRVYFFSSEMMCLRDGSACTKANPVSIERLHLNMPEMKSLGVDYLLSVATIGNADDLGLELIETFEHDHSAWSVTVYKVK